MCVSSTTPIIQYALRRGSNKLLINFQTTSLIFGEQLLRDLQMEGIRVAPSPENWSMTRIHTQVTPEHDTVSFKRQSYEMRANISE